MTATPLSGTQYTLKAGEYEAQIASVGASLRSLTHAGRDLVVPFEADQVRPASRGLTLVPWPNRIVDGVYEFGGARFQLPLTEPARSHALHGFGQWLDYSAVAQSESEVTLAATIQPQLAYPWRIRIETTFTLAESGLTQVVRATNESADAAPFGTAPHPYLVAGESGLNSWTLSLPADQVLEVTPDRLSPVALRGVEVDAARFDYREPRQLGEVKIDHAYTGLRREEGGTAAVRLTDPSGTGVEMTFGAECGWVQIHTADLPDTSLPGHRAGLAVEPMTCAPDVFNASRYDYDAGLIVIEPAATVSASWSIAAV